MSKMREANTLHDKMLDGNWLLKQKRKRISSTLEESPMKEGASMLSEFAKKSTSLRKKFKGEPDASQHSKRTKGHDGYYFECEQCDLGGSLLCCDNCPRTYHLECLSPPLKHAPAGKWQCPKCCNEKIDKPLSSAETSSRRARTTTIKKSMAVHSTSNDKASHSGRSLLGSRKSTSKGKAPFLHKTAAVENKSNTSHADISSNIKSSPSSDNVLRAGVSATALSKKKKKAISPPQKKITAQNASFVKSLNSDACDRPRKGKRNLHRCQSKKSNIPLVVSSQISKKNRKKINKIDRESSKLINGKHVSKLSNHACGEASPCPESCVSLPKCRSSEHLTFMTNMKQETHLLKSSRLKKSETSSLGASFLSHRLNGDGEYADKKMTYEEEFLHDGQQVDRILGCRVRNDLSCISETTGIATSQAEKKAEIGRPETEFQSYDFTGQENHSQVDDCFHGSKVIDTKLESTMNEGCHVAANLIDYKIGGDYSNELNKDVKSKTCGTIENMDKAADMFSSVSQSSQDHSMFCKGFEPGDNSAGVADVGEWAAKKDLEESIHAGFPFPENYSRHHMPRPSELLVTCESQDARAATIEPKSDLSSETVVPNKSVHEFSSKDADSVTYEYFVKWVGKSNIHNRWISEDQLKFLGKRKLENYKAKYGIDIINICEEQWCHPQRIVSLHELENSGGEVLVKWCGLPYDECTWERLDEPVVQNCTHLISELKQFECQTLEKDTSDDFAKNSIQEVVPLVEQPKELKEGLLFPHQLEALNWLRKCWHKSKNVILADEMGLGKTVSACSFISSLYFEFKVKLPCLVLVPLSTMPNWLAEFASWAPHLNVVEYHGCAKARSVIRQYEWHACDANRPDKLTKAYKFNVLLTTYEMILADSPHLRGVSWEVLIVDEGHRLKNSESKLFSLLNTFSFQNRVLLTGTPLQNNLGEMHNLLNFLQPSSFPSLSLFEEKFNDLSSAEKVEELKKLVAPHMLRRLKKDAMKNIPPKTERMVPVELTSIQAEYYRAMLTKNYQILRNNGKGIAQQSMLNIVMQLRKVCNHPYLIPGTEPESGSVEFLQEMRIRASAKLTLLHSMLKILHKEGHRVLIFSQMTKLLDILEDYLAVEFGLGTFERVDGSVSVADRQATIDRFNLDKTRFVFLLSTRSCGLGINLATADTVIIYDSDFNPHADIQAMNRAHRIGQSNRLLVYRLVVRASVEERILQLAKKKLMLDQLFVNKSDSQKEVEDILRWGTEEIFSDSDGVNGQDIKSDSINKCDATADGEYKHRRRAGGLGNVYKDRCTDGGTRITWDENAILKLLDRSNLQSGLSENADGDMENDMLGSVKSSDWTEESLNEEPRGSELLANPGDSCDPSSEAKEDNTNAVTEENEWDRLLRVRWEKSQLEEEAALGRGKRLRKAVSYKETLAAITSEALNESGNEEVEPEQEYTPAGRALKEKFAKLRSRQKERIAQRLIADVHSSVGRPLVEGLHNRGTNTKHSPDKSELNLSINLEESTCSMPFDSRCNDNSMFKNGRASKHWYKRYHSRHFDHSVNTQGNLSTDIIPPSNHLQKTSLATSVLSSSLLPVLGLCAPNASQGNPASRTSRTTVSKQASRSEQQATPIVFADFLPASAAVSGGLLSEANVCGGEALTDPSTLPDTPGVASHLPLKNVIPDKYFPFDPLPPEPSGRVLSDLDRSLGASFSSFHEKLGLPKLVLDDKLPVKFALPPRSSQKLQADFLSNFSLSANMEHANGCSLDPSNVPLAPKFKQEPSEMLKQKQQLPELPPMLGLGTVQTPHSLLGNHKKVLDNIMMRTRTAAHKFWKKRLKLKSWSEDELDALWIGVRRHGIGNWDAMLRDHRLKALKHRSIEELSSRWNEEQHKIIDGPASFPESSNFLSGLPNKFAAIVTEPPKFQSHLTDIRLACADLLPKFPSLDQFSHLGAVSEVFPPLPSGQADNSRSYYIEDMSVDMRKRLEKISLPLDQSFHFSSFSGSDFGGLGMSSMRNCSLTLNEDVFAANQTMISSSSPDKSSNLLNGTQNIHSGVSIPRMRFDAKKKHVLSKSSVDDDSIPGSSKVNKLPHWLREAVSAPSKPPEPVLPKSVSAIAQSVCVLYGEDKSKIPPFAIPEPLPLQPKDPRKNLKKRRKLDRLRQAIPDVSCSEGFAGISASSSIPTEPPMAVCSIPPAPPFMKCSISSVPPIMPCSFPPILAPPLLPSSIHSLTQLVTSSTHLTPSGMPSSILTAPSLMQSSITTVSPLLSSSIPPVPPFLSSSIHLAPMLLPSSISSRKTFMPCTVPAVPPFMQVSVPAEPTLAPCSFPPAPPLTAHLSCLPRNETDSILSSLKLNLSSASSSHGGLWSPAMSFPSPGVFPLVDPYTFHAPTTPAVPDVTALSSEICELAALKDPESSQGAGEGLIGDFQYFHKKQKDIRNSSLGCGGKLNSEQAEGIESGDSNNTMPGSCRDNEVSGLHETSSQETVLEQKREQES